MVLTLARIFGPVTVAILLAATPAGSQATRDTLRHVLEPEVFARVSTTAQRQVLYIGPGDVPGSMLVLTRHDLQEFTAYGRRQQVVPFAHELWQPFVARVADTAPRRLVGLRSRMFFRSSVEVLNLDGTLVARMRADAYSTVEAADVMGDEAQEVLIKFEDGVAVHSAAGQRLAFVRSPRYLYHFRTVAAADHPKRLIAMWMWRSAGAGADISVRRADGGEVAAWRENPSDRFAVFGLEGVGEALWSAVDGQIVARSAAGIVVRRFDVPGLRNFRYLHGGSLAAGWKVFVGFMGRYGDLVGRVVFVFDPSDALVAQHFSSEPAWAFHIPNHDGTQFFVGAGDAVLRYDIAGLRSVP